MASLQKRNDSYRVNFRHHCKLYGFTLGKVEPDEAENKSRQVDYLLMRLKQRLIQIPEGADIVDFVRFVGKPPVDPKLPESPCQVVTLRKLNDRYSATPPSTRTHAVDVTEARTPTPYSK